MSTLESPTRDERPSPIARHRLDPVALLFGTAFLTIGAARFSDRMGWMHVDNRVWFGTAMVTLGAIALVAVVVQGLGHRLGRNRHRP